MKHDEFGEDVSEATACSGDPGEESADGCEETSASGLIKGSNATMIKSRHDKTRETIIAQ